MKFPSAVLRGPAPSPRSGLWTCCLAIAVVWGIVLPAIASRPQVAARLDELAAQGIDPAAMYYTELPLMDEALFHIGQRRRRHPEAIWP